MWRSIALCSALLSLVSACSSSEDKARDRSEFCNDWGAAACSTKAVSFCQAADAAACRASQAAFCLDLVPSTFSDDKADACLEAVKSAYSDADLTAAELKTVLKLGPPCDAVVRGPGKAGDSCMESVDCDASSGLSCVIKGGETRGTCQIAQTVAAGYKCTGAQQLCAAGFYCDGSNCLAAKDKGEECVNNDECGTAGFCDQGTCAARYTTGADCTADEQCSSGICYGAEGTRTCVDLLRLSQAEPLCDYLR